VNQISSLVKGMETPDTKGLDSGVTVMEEKWPFLLMVIGLLVGLGYTISTMERNVIINHWTDRRCEIPVMFGGSFFKPDLDTRTPTEFAIDNFEFCIKSFVDRFVMLLLSPVHALFEKQVGAAGTAMNGLDSIRQMVQVIYNQFASYLEYMFKKFNRSVFEMSRIVQYLKMAIQKMNAIALSMIYTGISMFRGMLNTIRLIIRVVLIICGIMIAIIFFLWFILFPVIPIIIAALVMIIHSIYPFRGILDPAIQADAEDKKGPFCFAEGTLVSILDEKGESSTCPVEKIRVGQILNHGCGRVTAAIIMRGDGIPLYSVDGIIVSASHLIKGTDGRWKPVSEDERAIPTSHISPFIYCFNTTSNDIPLMSSHQTPIYFRDWEEIGNEDEKAQYMWNYLVSKLLNDHSSYAEWKEDIRFHCETPLMGCNVLVKTRRGWVPISAVKWGAILDRYGKEQAVLAQVEGEVEAGSDKSGEWHTEQYEDCNGIWRKSKNTVHSGTSLLKGWNLITESGEIVIWDAHAQKETIIRDFTEVGCSNIHKTYAFVEARLRM